MNITNKRFSQRECSGSGNRFRPTLCLLSLAFLTPALHAQDLDLVMPEPVPKLVEPEAPIAQTALEEQAALFEAMRQEYLGASGGETVILPALKGIILLKDEAQVDTVSLSPDAVSNLADYPDWDSADFRGLVDAFVGLPVSKESVDRLQSALRI